MKTAEFRALHIALLVVCGFGGLIFASAPANTATGQTASPAATSPVKKSAWKPEDFVFTEQASQFRVSPDGKWAVWVKSTADKDKDERVTNLILSSLTAKKEIPLTRGTDDVMQPRWSPSGETIAFIGTRAIPKTGAQPKADVAPMQIWFINAAGGEAWPMTDFEKGVKGFEWIDNDTILFSAEEDASLYEHQTKERKDDTNVVDDTPHAAPVRLYKLAVKGKKVARITDNTDWIENFDVSRDGRWAVATASRELSYAWDHKVAPATFLVDLASGKRTPVFPDGKIRPDMLRWARDNSGFYAVAPYSSDARFFTATVNKIYFYDLAGANTTEVNLDWNRYLGASFETTSDGFVALLADGVLFKAARYTKHGDAWSREWITGDQASHYFGIALGDDDHTLLYNYSTASTPGQWYRARLDGAGVSGAVQLTELNPQYKEKTIAKTDVLHWKGANGDDVEGILYYPLNYEDGKRYPLITATHGGPAGADHDAWAESWAYSNNLLSQRGAFILKTNYHGSSDYGLAWVESICCGKYYDLEIPDIEKGVDSLIARGIVDPDRIGALGWSNGSILSIQLLVTDPDRYKAAAVGAGDVEWISDWANVDFGESFDDYYFGKTPLQDPELYIRKSPLFKMDRVKTPTLIFFGTIDRQVPTEQGWTHYRALYSAGKVPVRFMLFPGEAHGPRKLSHQLRKVTEEAAWFDKYLFQTNPPENEAFKKDSPLGQALRRRSVARSGDLYGAELPMARTTSNTTARPTVVPEVVKRGEIEIGRFEVTRAQYSEFDTSYKVEPGTENFPANGISFERAQAYCKWLSGISARNYRLPREFEVTALYADHPGENTLDYWAGYAINPEDAQLLEEKIKQLPGDAPLLKEVGSFPGQGSDEEELVFDLGGNVAEWVIAADGSGKTLGGSADRPSDSKARYRPADLAYTGFRVALEASKSSK
jgi:dipeptidyl aminopeptidase/acylaminoacyl peptidase